MYILPAAAAAIAVICWTCLVVLLVVVNKVVGFEALKYFTLMPFKKAVTHTVPAPLLTAVIIFSHYFVMSAFL